MDRSVLELRVGGLPFPHGTASGQWSYRHAVRPEGATGLDHQIVSDFMDYETRHGRRVQVIADQDLTGWRAWRAPERRPHPGDFATQCCTHAYPNGCSSRLVCHGTPPHLAARILADGALRSAGSTSGQTPKAIAAARTWGEPPDYFEYVMLANGRCTAPEAVATSRLVGRDLVPADLSAGYQPSVRFYFDWDALAVRSDTCFDGVHPIKIHQALSLDEALVALIVHADNERLLSARTQNLRRRLVVLHHEHPSPQEWSDVANDAAETLA